MKILVLTSVFPNTKQPNLGLFVKERMFRVARNCDMKVVAPVPWFPLINRIKKNYRPHVPHLERIDGIDVHHPKFFNIPRYFKFLDGIFFFFSAWAALRTIRKNFDFDIIDAHFVYPDGVGAVLLSKVFRVPVTITVRGTIRKYFSKRFIRPQIKYALAHASRVFTVCEDLRKAALEGGVLPERAEVVANGIDSKKFRVADKNRVREELGIKVDRPVLISVGGLVERKGFHRVIEILPSLLQDFPDLLYIIVGGPSVEGNMEPELRRLVIDLNLQGHVLFAGPQPHEQLYRWLNAADLFVLATSNEGWANVFLEAMACGLPVVTTDVGGNSEVISSTELGLLVPFGDAGALSKEIKNALSKKWNRRLLIEYAHQNSWEGRVDMLLNRFQFIIEEKKKMNDKISHKGGC